MMYTLKLFQSKRKFEVMKNKYILKAKNVIETLILKAMLLYTSISFTRIQQLE